MKTLSVCLLLGCLAFAPRAMAAITCNASESTLDYGAITLPVSAQTSTSIATVTCTGNRNTDRGDTVRLCIGLNTPNSPRRMTNGASIVTHRLYRDPAYTQEINYADINAERVVTMPNALTFTTQLTIYGRLQGSSVGPVPGLYAETVTGDFGWSTTAGSCATVNALEAVSFQARGRIDAACTLATNPLNFGTVNVLATNVDTTTSLGLTCTTGAPWTIRMNGGTVAGNVAARQMGLGGAGPGVINYQLRHTSANGPLWGDGTSSTAVLTGTGTGSSQTVTVYGRVPGGQPPPPVGTYSDVVTVSVEY